MSIGVWSLAEQVLVPGGQQRILLWGAVLMAVVVVGGGAILVLRRHFRDTSGEAGDNPGFSLSDLREMRDRGEITSEEYEQTRARVIAKVKSSFKKNETREGASGGASDESGTGAAGEAEG